MKTTSLFFLIAVFGSNILIAQNFQGVATYKSMLVANLMDLDSTDANYERRKQMQELINKQFQKTYSLVFSNSESIYSEIPKEESLDKPDPSSSIKTNFSTSGGSSQYYRNIKENRFVNETEFLGKEFLIKDNLEPHDWVITDETKNIGAYTCYKATRTLTIQKTSSITLTQNDEQTSNENDATSKEVTIVAWYTPDISVNHGPDDNWGLPGLILEINNSITVSICNKIVLNPKDKITIKEPTKGKEISKKEFDDLVQKRMKNRGLRGN